MEVLYIPQDDRFYVRLLPEAVAKFPDGAFGATTSAPAYAMRIEGSGERVVTYLLVPGADGAFYWVALEDTRLARR